MLNGQNLTFGSPVTASTTAIWDVTTVGTADIILEADFDTGNGTVVDLSCVIVDDGSFTLPASTIAELDSLLGGSGWSLETNYFGRQTRVLQRSGNAALLVIREASDS